MINVSLRDRFFHPIHGHGVVVDIEEKKVMNIEVFFITLKTESGKTVKFPLSTHKLVGVKLM